MRDYGKVVPTFWTRGSGKRLRGCPEAQLVALYLMTCPASTMTGIFSLAIPTLAHEIGIPFEGASKGLRRVVQEGIAAYDEAEELVFVRRMVLHQVGDSLRAGDNRIKAIEKELATWENHRFVAEFRTLYHESHKVEPPAEPSPFEGPSKGLTKPLRSQDQDQDQDQDQEQQDPGSVEPGLSLAPSTPINPPAPQNAPDAATVAADARDPKRQAEIRAVHEHYLAGWHRVVSGTRAPILDRTRAGKIRARLAEGYSQEDLCRAIDGMWASEWHVENRRWDLELVVRDAKHVDQFLAKAPAPASPPAPATQLPPAEPAWVLRERAAAAAPKPCAPPADLPRIGQLDLVTTGDVIAERLAHLAPKEGSA